MNCDQSGTIGLLGQQRPELRMPAEVVLAAVAMRANGPAQSSDFVDQRFAIECVKVFVHWNASMKEI